MSSRTLFATIALAVVLFAGALSSSFGQNPDICKPDCNGSNFGATQVTTVTLPNGCVVKVKYATRLACGMWNDLGIISVEPLSPQCNVLTIKQLLDLTTIEMLKNNPMGFPTPGIDSCTTQWRVVNGACWKDSTTCDGDSILTACDLSACCLNGYKICKDSLGVINVTHLGGTSTEDCDTNNPYCVPVCGDDPGNSFGEPGLSGIHVSGPGAGMLAGREPGTPVAPTKERAVEKTSAVIPEGRSGTRNR